MIITQFLIGLSFPAFSISARVRPRAGLTIRLVRVSPVYPILSLRIYAYAALVYSLYT
jgi:hypothetical protein